MISPRTSKRLTPGASPQARLGARGWWVTWLYQLPISSKASAFLHWLEGDEYERNQVIDHLFPDRCYTREQ